MADEKLVDTCEHYACEYCGSDNPDHTIEECLAVCLAPETTTNED